MSEDLRGRIAEDAWADIDNSATDPRRAGFSQTRQAFSSGGTTEDLDEEDDSAAQTGGDTEGIKEKLGKGVSWVRGHLPQIPSIQRPNIDISSAVSAIEKTNQSVHQTSDRFFGTRLLHAGVDKFFNNFDWRDKNRKVWLSSMGVGTATLIGAVEFGASLGFSPAIRSAVVGSTLFASGVIYEALHARRLKSAIKGSVNEGNLSIGDEQREQVFKRIRSIEKDLTKKRLQKEDFETQFKDQLYFVLQSLGFVNPDAQTELEDKLGALGRDYGSVNSVARSLTAGLGAGAVMGAISDAALIRNIFSLESDQTLATIGRQEVGNRPETIQPDAPQPPSGEGTSGQGATQPPGATTPSGTGPDTSPGGNPPPRGPEDTGQTSPSPARPEQIKTFANSKDFVEVKAAGVGSILPQAEIFAVQATQQIAQNTSNLLPEQSAAVVKKAVQNFLENQANKVYDSSLQSLDSDSVAKASREGLSKLRQVVLSDVGQKQLTEIARKAVADESLLQAKAAGVGEVLQKSDVLLKKAVDQIATSSQVHPTAGMESVARKAAQTVLEQQANVLYEQNSQAVLQKGAQAVSREGIDKLNVWIFSEAGQKRLADEVAKATKNVITADLAAKRAVEQALNNSSSYTTQVIPSGSTIGHMLNLEWNPVKDARKLGGILTANYDLFDNSWFGIKDNLGVSEAFPVSLSEIEELVRLAEAGDQKAYQRLVKAAKWIRAGTSLKIPTQSGLKLLFAKLK